MSIMKPVWRINTGNGVPSDSARHPKLLFSGVLTDGLFVADRWNWDISHVDHETIKAYETNRTKAAKFKVVACQTCDGDGFLFNRGWLSLFVGKEKCPICKGRKHTRERIV